MKDHKVKKISSPNHICADSPTTPVLTSLKMGNQSSMTIDEKETQIRRELDVQRFTFDDLAIDPTIVIFSGLQSNKFLHEKSSSHFKNCPARMKELVVAGKALSAYPNAVGIGAVLIYWMLEEFIAAKTSSINDSTSNLKKVFAKEKESQIYNVIQSFFDRFKMFLRDSAKLQEETRIFERKLGSKLKALKNSLLSGHMSSSGFKVWVNGAAFHIQMLIHLVRLERGDSEPVKVAIGNYQRDLDEIIDSFIKFKRNTIKVEDGKKNVESSATSHIPDDADVERFYDTFKTVFVRDSETNEYIHGKWVEEGFFTLPSPTKTWADPYYVKKHLFEQNQQIPRLREYFCDTLRDLDVLIELDGSLDLQSIVNNG